MYKIINDNEVNIIQTIIDHTSLKETNIHRIKSIGYDQILVEDRKGNLLVYDMILESSRKLSKNPNLKKEIAERIKTIMNRKWIKEKDLAKKIKVSQSTISRYLKGQTMPNLITLKKIADALNCYIDDFFYNRF